LLPIYNLPSKATCGLSHICRRHFNGFDLCVWIDPFISSVPVVYWQSGWSEGTIKYQNRQVTNQEDPVKKNRARNRPTPASRAPLRERILNAAFCAFKERGYAGASMLEIATRAKVSKRELYALCEDKAALLRDAIAERARHMRLSLELPAPKNRRALAATLTAFGTALLRGVCDPAVRAVYWLAISESDNAPEVARLLDKVGRRANRAALAQTLAQAQADGLFSAGVPATMAVEFCALLWGDLLLQLLLRVAEPPTPQAMEQKAREAADKFLRLYPPPHGS
jgi:AcrR family transcriptional regulator